MFRLLISFSLLTLISFSAEAFQRPSNPPTLPASTPALQELIGVSSESAVSWNPSGVADESIVWSAHLRQKSGRLAFATGTPFILDGSAPGVRPSNHAVVEFIRLNAEFLGLQLDPSSTVLWDSHGRLTTAHVSIGYGGVPVQGSYATLAFNSDFEVIEVKAAGFNSDISGTFKLSDTQARTLAKAAISAPSEVSSSSRIYLPISGTTTPIQLRAAYRIELTTRQPDLQPTIYIDAEYGTILAAENRVRYVEVAGGIEGTYYPMYGRQNQAVIQFPNEWLRVAADTGFTDVDGAFMFDIEEELLPALTISELRGHWAMVLQEDENNGELTANCEGGDNAPLRWTNENSRADERNAYVHVNIVHDYYKNLEPDFDGLDFPMLIGVGLDMDNAFSTGDALYFGRGNQADNFAHYADVIYHEYAHSVTAVVYSGFRLPYEGESGALNEGWSDYFACSYTDEPLIGEGGLIGNGHLRNLDNGLVYPRDIRGEVHDDGRIIAAAMWHTREQLDHHYADSLFHFARYLHGNDFREYFQDVLLTDDDDGDITNGTPNYQTIYEQFGGHGIDLGDAPHFRIGALTITDEEGNGIEGDGDHFFEPGEIIGVTFRVFRAGNILNRANDPVIASVATDSPHLEPVRNRVEIGVMAPGEAIMLSEPLLLSVTEEASVEFATVYVTVEAAPRETPASDTLKIALGLPPVALVRQGGTLTDRSPWYHRALDKLDLIYYDLTSNDETMPLMDMLPNFENVIWFTGDEHEGVLGAESRVLMTRYLETGGSLILTGQYLREWDSATEFLADRFGVRFLSDSLTLNYALGDSSDPVGEGMRLLLQGGQSAMNRGLPAQLEAVNGGIVTHRWSRLEGQPAAAIRRTDQVTHSRTIFFGFGLEAIGGAGRTDSLHNVLRASLDWFASEEEDVEMEVTLPSDFTVGSPYPSPFNGTLTIPVSMPVAGSVEIKLFDLSGREVYSTVQMAKSGASSVTIDPAFLGSGEYLIRLTWNGTTLTRTAVLLK
jgi:hypothetical protein